MNKNGVSDAKDVSAWPGERHDVDVRANAPGVSISGAPRSIYNSHYRTKYLYLILVAYSNFMIPFSGEHLLASDTGNGPRLSLASNCEAVMCQS